MPKTLHETGTLASSTQTDSVIGKNLDITLSGTWVGTVALQRYVGSTWISTGDTWTANAADVAEAATPGEWRLDFTRTSGSLVYDLRGGDSN